jgi:hypothetical protein
MTVIKASISVLLVSLIIFSAQSQGLLNQPPHDDGDFLASNKQLGQFFKRFNGEEDVDGKSFQPGDRRYRDGRVRKNYLPLLIDPAVVDRDAQLVEAFFESVADKKSPGFIDFHSDTWEAEVSARFIWQGKPVTARLFMQLQTQGQGYEWVIVSVDIDEIESKIKKLKGEEKPFLHPMSHELNFMNLNKALNRNASPSSYTLDGYQPDILSIFFFEINQNRLVFEDVQSVRFHFYSIPGWYFEVSEFNRPGTPSGWLISNLVQANDEQKDQIRSYIYGK